VASLETLFARYAGDLERYAPALAGQFQCPLCLRVIPRSDPLGEVVAEEHVVPGALGGRITTLTCKRCNNDQGSELESHLVQRVLVEANRAPVDFTFRMRDAVMRGEMPASSPMSEPHPMKVIDKRSDERRVAEIQELLKDPKDDIHLHVEYGYSEKRALVAVLRAAYLLMFRTFGYGYVLDRSAVPVRAQIREWKCDLPVLDGITWRMDDPLPSGTMVTEVMKPAELQSFTVLLQLDAETRHFAAASLPVPGSDGEDLYARIREYRASRTKATFTAMPVPLLPEGFLPYPGPPRPT
jgi:hypothetical protein